MIRQLRNWFGFDEVEPWTRGEKMTCIGFLTFMLGASAADSDGYGYLIAAGISLVGIVIMFIGLRIMKREEAVQKHVPSRRNVGC